MNRVTSIVGGLLLGVAYGAFAGCLLGSGAIAFGSWIHHFSQAGSSGLQEAWAAPYLLSVAGVPIGGLAGAVLGARSYQSWEQRRLAKFNPSIEALPDDHTWPPPPHHS